MITLGNMLYVRDQNGDFVPVMGGGGGSGDVPSFLTGYKYDALGDSIVSMQGTTGSPKTFGDSGYSADLQGRAISGQTVQGYIQAIEGKYGLVCTNLGAAGHTLVADYAALAGRSYADTAVVTIAYGVNDARTGVPLGTVNSTDVTTFAGALNQLIRKIYTDNPECRVLVLAPLQRLYVSEFGIATPNANGNYLIDFVNMCKAVAEKRSTGFVDQYRASGLNQTNLYYYTVEGVHPVNQGFARIANCVLSTLDGMCLTEFVPLGTMTNTGGSEPDEPETGGGNETPPEEDESETVVDVSGLLTMDGYYYDGYADKWGQGKYVGTPLPLPELIPNKTYTLYTVWESATGEAANGMHRFGISKDANATAGRYAYQQPGYAEELVETLADGAYLVKHTIIPDSTYYFLSIPCLVGYTEHVKLSYV